MIVLVVVSLEVDLCLDGRRKYILCVNKTGAERTVIR